VIYFAKKQIVRIASGDDCTLLKMSGIRLNWIRERVYELLNISDYDVFSEFLERDGERFKGELLRYLSQTQDGSEIAMLFYKVRRQEEERIEVEITESEPPESVQSSSAVVTSELSGSVLTAEPSDISAASSAATGDVKVKKGKGKKAKSSKKKADEEAKRAAELEEAAAKAAAEAELQQQQQEDDKVPRTKTIIQKVWREYLYMVSGIDISFELILQRNCVIFLRTQDDDVPEPLENDALVVNRLMAKHFEIITLHSNGLILLDDMLAEVYMPLLTYFEHRMSYVLSTEEMERVPSETTDLKTADRVSSKSSEGKASASTGVVFTMLRDEFMHQMHKFKAAIGVVKDQLEARVNLVVPSSLHLEDTVEDTLANVELVQQVEEVCIHWYKQVFSFFSRLQTIVA